MLPAIVMVVVLVGLSVWAADVRGLYLAVAIGAVIVVHAVRGRRVEDGTDGVVRTDPLLFGADSGPMPYASTRVEEVLTVAMATFLGGAVVLGGVLGWLATHSLVAAAGAAVIAGAASLLITGVVAALAAAVSVLLGRRRTTG